jgi:hypothetical protein
MRNNSSKMDDSPFWADEPEIPHYFQPKLTLFSKKYIYFFLIPQLVLLFLSGILVGLLIFDSIFFQVVWTVIWIFMGYKILRRVKQVRENIINVKSIQQKAKEMTCAQFIGSAIHVAGYPQLERDQPVVLALVGGRLDIYLYDQAQPLASLDLDCIENVDTVVYDDERVPHLGVIDSAAQALQIKIVFEKSTWTCLFRQMKKLRPIDWYHAIQQARAGVNSL